MNRIEQRFAHLRDKGETAFIPFVTGGDPTLDQTEAIVYALEQAGADVIELGVPFSDPVGDGPVIQDATLRALEKGTTPSKIFELVKKIRQKSEVPILIFTYFNPILAHGVENFARHVAEAGADGVLCVDLPPEEADEHKAALDKHGLSSVFLTAPTTSDSRLDSVARQCSGFVYYVSRLGVTGEQAALEEHLKENVHRIKHHTELPVAVGFGISTPDHARDVAGIADGVVVGSAIVRLIGELGDAPDTAEKVGAFAKELADAAKSAVRA